MKLNIQPGKKALITTNNWFYGPDGKSYRAVFGTVKAVRTATDTLGISPNGKSTNWYAEIGNMTLAGCQIHYAIQTDICNSGTATHWTSTAADGLREYEQPCAIYFTDEKLPENEEEHY